MKRLILASVVLLSVLIVDAPFAYEASPAGGNWLELDGSDDFAWASDIVSLDVGDEPSEDFTIEAWKEIKSEKKSQI